MSRHHGFTCPKCGSHMFGTYTYQRLFGDKYPGGTQVGHCNEHSHSGNGCTFEWNREDPKAESECMYEQTEAEWLEGQKAFLQQLKQV